MKRAHAPDSWSRGARPRAGRCGSIAIRAFAHPTPHAEAAPLRHRSDHPGDLGEDLLDLALAHDQRRRERDGVAGDADDQVLLVERLLHRS